MTRSFALICVLLVGCSSAPTWNSGPTWSFDDMLTARSGTRYTFRWASDGKHLAKGRGDNLKWFEAVTGLETKVQEPNQNNTPADPLVSPDGQSKVERRDSNLFLNGKQLTTDGGEEILYGQLDWVYQEEVFGRGTWNALWWSPTSEYFAYLRLDDTQVPDFTYIDHRELEAKPSTGPYPHPGEPNPTAQLWITSSKGRSVQVDLSRFPDDLLIVAVTWDGNQLYVQVQDRIQSWLELLSVHPETGVAKTVIHEESRSWVDSLGAPYFLEDDSFLWLSDRSGYRHLYRYLLNGRLLEQLTEGEWDVLGIEHVDNARGEIYFSCRMGSAIGRQLCRTDFYGRGLRQITTGHGTHYVSFSADGQLFLDRYSAIDVPPRLTLHQRDGEIVRTVELPESGASMAPERLVIRARDGTPLDALLWKPRGFRESGNYPVFLSIYSGPGSQSVRDQWQRQPWFEFLAQQGVLVLRVNNRTSSGRGKVFIEQCYRRLGVLELRDLEDAVEWLCDHPWADAERVAITGHSYGGFMAAYALTHSDKFALGLAASGVYDWRLYDSIYTERFMDRPQDNPEGYADTSCIEAAGNLKGHLVLLHGGRDDNVHLHNTFAFAHALQKAGKSFDLMVYPGSRHGFGRAVRKHHYQLRWKVIQEVLLP